MRLKGAIGWKTALTHFAIMGISVPDQLLSHSWLIEAHGGQMKPAHQSGPSVRVVIDERPPPLRMFPGRPQLLEFIPAVGVEYFHVGDDHLYPRKPAAVSPGRGQQ